MSENKQLANPELALPGRFVPSQTPQVNVQQISDVLQVENIRLQPEEQLKVLTM
jgi:hypothetical protein